VAGIEPAGQGVTLGGSATRSNLTLRVLSAAVLAPLAIFVAWLGGWPFALFWGIAALIVLSEWFLLVTGKNALAAVPWNAGQLLWIGAGILYAGALLVATLQLRADATFGFAAILFVFAVVWTTDIAAYFVGRAAGGPKLMPRVSPKKTWSGAIGGTVGGVAAGTLVAALSGLGSLAAIGLVALVLSVISQAGDLLESAIKRRFDAKDSSGLIPGHGGLMVRLDGYATAVVAAGLIGLARGGFATPARGLMVW
jgi:phosphatidate cytidylyltransferase